MKIANSQRKWKCGWINERNIGLILCRRGCDKMYQFVDYDDLKYRWDLSLKCLWLNYVEFWICWEISYWKLSLKCSIQAFGSQKASMDRDTQQAVFTHFIKPFLSRNDSTGKRRNSSSLWFFHDNMWYITLSITFLLFLQILAVSHLSRGAKRG